MTRENKQIFITTSKKGFQQERLSNKWELLKELREHRQTAGNTAIPKKWREEHLESQTGKDDSQIEDCEMLQELIGENKQAQGGFRQERREERPEIRD